MNRDELQIEIEKWVIANCDPIGTPENNSGWKCKKCKVDIQGRGKTVSLHFKSMMLAGGGETKTIIEPYCPKCGNGYSIPPFIDYGGLRDIF